MNLQTLEDLRQQALKELRNYNPQHDYVWDGVDEDDRPLTEEEMLEGHRRYLEWLQKKERKHV